MTRDQLTELSEAMQRVDGPISGDIRNAIIRLSELHLHLPGAKALEARNAVIALADCCIRVRGLENAVLADTAEPKGAA